MISLEQVLLLETRVAKAIDYVKRLTAENAALSSERAGLQAKLEANQKRIDELEVLIMGFKEDQGRIEDGIIAALDRLSQFEEAFEKRLKDEKETDKKPAVKAKTKAADSSNPEKCFEIAEEETTKEDISSEGELDIF